MTNSALKLKLFDVAKLIPLRSTAPACGCGCRCEMPTANPAQSKKTRPTRSIKGSSGANTLKAKDSTAEAIAAVSAAVAVVLG